MLNPRLAGRYAKSLLGLAIEQGSLEKVYEDMQYLLAITKSNRDFVSIIKSPVIPSDKKEAVLEAVAEGRMSDLTRSFNRLLVRKGRETNLPEIAQSFIDLYKQHKQIHSIRLVTASPVSDDVKNSIVNKVKAESGMENIELTATVDENIIGGFVLQVGDKLVDASIAYDLNAIRKQFLNNDFIYKIR